MVSLPSASMLTDLTAAPKHGLPKGIKHKAYRCQSCNVGLKKLAIARVHTESYCLTCGDDTEWILEEEEGVEGAEMVQFIVGGTVFYTNRQTFTDDGEDTLFTVLLSNRYDVMQNGAVIVDRPAKWFQKIIDFCRQGSLVGQLNHTDLAEIEEEAQYYCLSKLLAHIESLRSEMPQQQDPCQDAEEAKSEEREYRYLEKVLYDCNEDLRDVTCLQFSIRGRVEEVNRALSAASHAEPEKKRALHEACTNLIQTTNETLSEVVTSLQHVIADSGPEPSIGCHATDDGYLPISSAVSSSFAAPTESEIEKSRVGMVAGEVVLFSAESSLATCRREAGDGDGGLAVVVSAQQAELESLRKTVYSSLVLCGICTGVSAFMMMCKRRG